MVISMPWSSMACTTIVFWWLVFVVIESSCKIKHSIKVDNRICFWQWRWKKKVFYGSEYFWQFFALNLPCRDLLFLNKPQCLKCCNLLRKIKIKHQRCKNEIIFMRLFKMIDFLLTTNWRWIYWRGILSVSWTITSKTRTGCSWIQTYEGISSLFNISAKCLKSRVKNLPGILGGVTFFAPWLKRWLRFMPPTETEAKNIKLIFCITSHHLYQTNNINWIWIFLWFRRYKRFWIYQDLNIWKS